MRPLERVAKPGSYPYEISVASEADLDSDLGEYDLAFPRSPNVGAAFTTRMPTLLQILNGLLDIATDSASAEVLAAKQTLTNRLGDEYKKAAPGLAASYGKFCSYCDQVLAAETDVEHVVPKAPYPKFQLCWDNFLLACVVCNSNKLNKPPRGTAAGWAGPMPDEVDLYDAIRAHYQWPDKAGSSYSTVVPTLFMRTVLGWKERDDVGMRTDFTARVKDLPSRRVQAAIPGGPLFDVQVRDVPADLPASAIVELCGLQKDGTEGGWGISDTRMYNRTLAWFDIVQELAWLRAEDWQERFGDRWPSVIRNAPRYGFFSVWVRILDLMGATAACDPVQGHRSVMQAFYQDAEFPGTDLSDLPS